MLNVPTLMLWVNANIEVIGDVIVVCYLALVDSRGYFIIGDIHVIVKANSLIVPADVQCLSAVVNLWTNLRSSWCVPVSILVRLSSTICCTKQCSIAIIKTIQHDQGVVHQSF